ncbi:unnamed protein product [Withania somnifera]
MKNIGTTRSSRRWSKSRIKQQTESSPSDYAATPLHPSSHEVSDLSPHYAKATSCSEGKRGHLKVSPHSSESSFDSSDQSWISSSRKPSITLSRTSSLRSVKILINKSSSKSKRSNSNHQQVQVKSTCSSTLKDSKFPQHVELHPGQSESDRISKVKVCSYHHCSLNRRSDDSSSLVKRVYRRRRPSKSVKSIGIESESTDADHFSLEESDLIQDGGIFGENEVTEYADLVERSYQETIDIMRTYSTQDQDTLVTTTSKCCNRMERERNESTSVCEDVESIDLSGITSAVCGDEDRDADICHILSLPLLLKPSENVTTDEEVEKISGEPSTNEPFAIKRNSDSDDLVEAKCSIEFSSASASNTRMELEEKLQEIDGKANPTEDFDLNDSAKTLHIANIRKEKRRSMWSLIHRHMIFDESTELVSKVTREADKENHEDGGNKLCAEESSDSVLNFAESESVTINQDADNQENEVRKLLAIKLVREAIERILLAEFQDQSSDDQSVTSEVCTGKNSKELDTKNEECDKASKSDEVNITSVNIDSPEKQNIGGQGTNEAEKKAPKHWSNLKRWIILQRFIKELEKLRKFNPRKPRYLQLEPDPEAEKVNLKHQIEDERKSAEEWMVDYALQKAICQLAPTQKRKVGLLVTAFETVVPPRGSNIKVTFPKLRTRNEENLQISDNVREKYSTRLDKRKAKDDWSMLKNDDTQKVIVHCQKLDEVTCTSTDKVSVEGKANQQVKDDGHSKLEPEAGTNVPKASHGQEEFGDSHDDSPRRTSSTIPNLRNGGGAEETNMNLSSDSKRVVKESITVSSDENIKITESEDEKRVNKQKQISMWHMVSEHILSDIVSKVGSELLDGTDNEVDYNKTLTETNAGNSIQDFSEEKDDISQYGRSFSRNDAVNLIREAVHQILTTTTHDDSSDTQCGEQNSTNSFCISLIHRDSLETDEFAANTITKLEESVIPHAKTIFEPSKSNYWSKLKELILLKRSIKALERSRKINPQPPQLLPLRKKAEQWMLNNAMQHMVNKLSPARETRVAMLVEAFEAVVPLPEV